MTTEPLTCPPAPDAPGGPDYGRLAAGFSHRVLGVPLHPYEQPIVAAILESVLNGHGTTFTVMMARQMGKNELSAHLEAALRARFATGGDTLIRASPTFRPRVTTSLQHPLIQTQYLLQPLSEAGAFFTPDQRALLRGTHPRQPVPSFPTSGRPSFPLSAAERG